MCSVEGQPGVRGVDAAGAARGVEGEVAADGASGEGAEGGRRSEGGEGASSRSVCVFRAAHCGAGNKDVGGISCECRLISGCLYLLVGTCGKVSFKTEKCERRS